MMFGGMQADEISHRFASRHAAAKDSSEMEQ
jgi:hypothetical protein